MPKIEKLNDEVSRSITTGQVCVDLSGVIKELVDNSLDAKCNRITIKLFNNGSEKIQVEDNGYGINEDDFELLAVLHSTSKIKSHEELQAISTYGFRGEALNSLSLSSSLSIQTKVKDGKGFHIFFDSNGKYIKEKTKEISKNVGTTVIITEFMSSYPVRRNEFLTKLSKEVQKVVKMLQNYVFARTDVSFELMNIVNGRSTSLLKSSGGLADIKSTISYVFADKTRYLDEITELNGSVNISEEAETMYKTKRKYKNYDELGEVKFYGYVGGLKNINKNNTDYVFVAVNNRPINSSDIKKTVKLAYHKFNPSNGILLVLHIIMPNDYFDINCSPLKDVIQCRINDLLLAKLHSCLVATLEKNNDNDCVVLKERCTDDLGFSISIEDKITQELYKNQKKSLKVKPIDNNMDERQTKLTFKRKVQAVNNDMDEISKKMEKKNEDEGQLINESREERLSLIKNVSKYDADIVNETIYEKNNTSDTKVPTNDFFAKKRQAALALFSSTSISATQTNYSKAQTELEPVVREDLVNEYHDDKPLGVLGDEKKVKCINVQRVSRKIKFSMKQLDLSMDKLKKQISSINKEQFHMQYSSKNDGEAEEKMKLILRKDDFTKMEIIGQFNCGFIVTKLNSNIFIIDQHASDEIFNFESFTRAARLKSQSLIKPLTLKLGAIYEDVIRENLEIFEKSGFKFKFLDDNTTGENIQLINTPSLNGYIFESSDVEEMAVHLAEYPGLIYRPSKIRKIFASKACRKSVMIGTPLTKQKMKTIVENLATLEIPWNCPHGRPTVRQLYRQ
uniref:DNA mismatch repair protein MLH2 n=1 Tax=Parastrongyloides trichosuri TaxID=131310 RepID=A0A0N4ZR31_PARTI